MKNRATILVGCILLAAIGVSILVFKGIPGIFKVEVRRQYVPVVQNPLAAALDNNLPDQEFEELVRRLPQWVNLREEQVGKKPLKWSVLSDCVLARKTNYIRILIRNGADVGESKDFFTRQLPEEESLQLLMQVIAEVAPTNSPALR